MRRLGLSLLLVVVMAVVGAGWAIDRLFVRLDKPDQILKAAEVLGYELAASLDASALDLSTNSPVNEASGFALAVMNQDGIALPQELQQLLSSGQALTLESDQGVALYFLMPNTQRVLSVALPEPSRTDTQLRLLLTLLFYAAIATLILLWLYPLARRLQRLASAAKRFGEGQLKQRIQTHRRSQLYGIESEFNRMAQRIQGLLDDNKMLSSAVSHDLKTPLARLRFGVDALSEHSNNSLQEDYLARISDDLTQMEELVQVLLEFARIDQRLSELPLKATALLPIVKQSIERFSELSGCQIELHSELSSEQIMAEPRYTGMLVNNLLQNAGKFADKSIAVSLSNRSGKVSLLIDDDGPGFSEDTPESLFKPFEKGSRRHDGKATSGHGMGLAIVKRVADWHNADVRLGRSDTLGGARVSVVFDAV